VFAHTTLTDDFMGDVGHVIPRRVFVAEYECGGIFCVSLQLAWPQILSRLSFGIKLLRVCMRAKVV